VVLGVCGAAARVLADGEEPRQVVAAGASGVGFGAVGRLRGRLTPTRWRGVRPEVAARSALEAQVANRGTDGAGLASRYGGRVGRWTAHPDTTAGESTRRPAMQRPVVKEPTRCSMSDRQTEDLNPLQSAPCACGIPDEPPTFRCPRRRRVQRARSRHRVTATGVLRRLLPRLSVMAGPRPISDRNLRLPSHHAHRWSGPSW